MAQNGSDPASMVLLRVIGGFGLSVRGRAIDLRNRKAQAILGHLALSAPSAQSRERLADALWSESGGEQARQSLRQTLHDLRRALGGDADAVIVVRRADVALAPGFAVDLFDLIDIVETADAPPETLDWSGLADAILPGLDDVDPVFCEWLAARRAALLARLTAVLERRMAEAEGEEARPWAAALVALDPAHEPACRRLMESDAARGDVRAALKRYAVLWDLLDEEYAAEPSPETQELAVRLKSLEARPATVERPALTLCMGEFRLDGVPDSHGYLVRGFRQDLIALLTSYREWVVIEPGPGGQAPNADGVYEIEGVSYPARDGVRINVTLKETAARRFIWGQQDIDLTLAQWFETCRVTTRKLAAALNVRISADRLAKSGREDDLALPLYDQLLRARDLLTRWTPEDDARAEAIFRAILRADPLFPRAKTGIAQILNTRHILYPGWKRPDVEAMEALLFAHQSVEADPLDAEAQLCLGWSCAMVGKSDEAASAFLAAADMNPTHPRTLASASAGLGFCGVADKAVELAEASAALDSGAVRLHWAYRASAYVMAGDWENAIEAVRRASGATLVIAAYPVVSLVALGQQDAARAAWRDCVATITSHWVGDQPPAEDQVAAWLLGAVPINRAQLRRRFAELLAAAGAPVREEA